ncbi:CoA transferase [Mycolicibacterium sp. 018/SC-01/001]|uniref:CoA transferase n=1 Tax=Mycolicibacterium sp. 018/SC-01/001 TaxID=2592069 RepID=UPI0021071084|nr:CoA transferase [Mycolicibacterium sp. 018/SC-01/001]
MADLRVIEISGQYTGIAGRVLAELGADVIVVEPPNGSPERTRPPFVGDEPGAERSLRWWAANVGKRGVTVDQGSGTDVAQLLSLIETADIVIAAGDRLGDTTVAYDRSHAEHPGLIWVSITPFGLAHNDIGRPVTDLTMLAATGPVWNCGYDDRTVPPMRGAGEQSANIAGMYAAIGALTALSHRDHGGRGQLVDVNVAAACNVTCEQATYYWLAVQGTVLRQTGRHAGPYPSSKVQVRCADGEYATTGVLPRKPSEFAGLLAWLGDLGLTEQLPEAVFLQLGADREDPVDLSAIGADDEATAILSAAREAISLIAANLPAKRFFVDSQRRGFPAGAVMSPQDAFDDEHTRARGFGIPVAHPELDRTVVYPGTPYLFGASPTSITRRPPLIGEHNELMNSRRD